MSDPATARIEAAEQLREAAGAHTLTFDVHKSWWLSANQRLHWAEKATRTRWLRQLACTEARRARVPSLDVAHIGAFIGYPTAAKADPSNAFPTIKACVDGLVDAAVFADDDATHVIGPTFLRDPKSPTRDHYRVRLVITSQEIPW